MLEVNKLYPQYNFVKDRRTQSVPVEFDRRSGLERRSESRITLDTNLTRDIFEVKNKVAQAQNKATKKADKITFSQNISKAVQNSLKSDQFVKSTKDVAKETANLAADKKHSGDGALAGILAVVFGGTIASTFLGVAGVGIALSIGAYFGGKALRSAIVSHLKHK